MTFEDAQENMEQMMKALDLSCPNLGRASRLALVLSFGCLSKADYAAAAEKFCAEFPTPKMNALAAAHQLTSLEFSEHPESKFPGDYSRAIRLLGVVVGTSLTTAEKIEKATKKVEAQFLATGK